MMTPEPTDKLDAATTVVVNGPADDPLEVERIARRRPIGPTRACFEPDASKGARPVVCPADGYVERVPEGQCFPCSARFGGVIPST